jgi:DNA polymerase-3 subunit gamma/tau
MSYRVLARKYRPQTFDEIVGQAHVATTLTNALRSQKIAQLQPRHLRHLFLRTFGSGAASPIAIISEQKISILNGIKIFLDPDNLSNG